jgi:hypothetical protein
VLVANQGRWCDAEGAHGELESLFAKRQLPNEGKRTNRDQDDCDDRAKPSGIVVV